MNKEVNNQYEDIINLPHHVSATRAHMSIYDRAAQFSPFAALTGHDEAIKEKARITDERMELDEGTKQLLDERLQLIRQHIDTHPKVTITYFVPDERKEGGSYVTVQEKVVKLNEYKHIIYMDNGKTIPIWEVVEIEGDLFKRMDL